MEPDVLRRGGGARAAAPAATATVSAERASAVSGAALCTFANIADAWGLSVEERLRLLGGVPKSTYHHWMRNPDRVQLSRDTLERLSYVFGIFKDLQVLFPEHAVADAWIKAPNAAPLFGGRSALDRMLLGRVSDLYVVRRYLDAQRGMWV